MHEEMKKILQFAGPDSFLNRLITSFCSCPSMFYVVGNRSSQLEAKFSGLAPKEAKFGGQSPKEAKTSGLVYTLCHRAAKI